MCIYGSMINKDIEYWIQRWHECFPVTYPPELRGTEILEYRTGWWIFGHTEYKINHVCIRCGKILETGHVCEDILEYLRLKRQRELLEEEKNFG